MRFRFLVLLPFCVVLWGVDACARDITALCAARAAETPVVRGSDNWLFLPAELRHVAAGKFWGAGGKDDPLPAILDFKEQLAAAGIELLMVPVPPKVFVYPEPLAGGEIAASAPDRADVFHREFYRLLREAGIVVVDLLPDLLANRTGPDGPVYCRRDSHWSGAGAVLAARRIADLFRGKDWAVGRSGVRTVAETRETSVAGDLATLLETENPTPETLRLRFIRDEAGQPVAPDKTSPLVLLGDSHCLIFSTGEDMLATGAGLPDQIAHELGIPVDLIAVRGSGATPARVNLMRRVRSDPSWLVGKRAVVWCFSAREFTESSGWMNVPVVAPTR